MASITNEEAQQDDHLDQYSSESQGIKPAFNAIALPGDDHDPVKHHVQLNRPFVMGEVTVWSSQTEREQGNGLIKSFAITNCTNVRGVRISKFVFGFDNLLALDDTGTLIHMPLPDSLLSLPQTTTTATIHDRLPNRLKDARMLSAKELADSAESTNAKFWDVAVGRGFAAGIREKDRRLYTWGRGVQGQLGLGHTRGSDRPALVKALPVQVKEVACGECHLVVLSTAGQVYTSGRGFEGQLGQGVTKELDFTRVPQMSVRLAPKYVQALMREKVTQIACGNHFTAALSDSGTVWTWGEGVLGQLGDGRKTCRCVPMPVHGPINKDAREEEDDYMLMLESGGLPTYSVDNGGNEMNVVSGTELGQTASVESGLSAVTDSQSDGISGVDGEESTDLYQTSVGRANLNGVSEATSAVTSVHGEMDIAEDQQIRTPEQNIQPPETNHVVNIACGFGHVLALSSDGSIFAWGFNLYGQLGLGDVKSRFFPQRINSFSNSPIDCVKAGNNTSAVIDADGTTWQWGARLYDGTPPGVPDIPQGIPFTAGMMIPETETGVSTRQSTPCTARTSISKLPKSEVDTASTRQSTPYTARTSVSKASSRQSTSATNISTLTKSETASRENSQTNQAVTSETKENFTGGSASISDSLAAANEDVGMNEQHPETEIEGEGQLSEQKEEIEINNAAILVPTQVRPLADCAITGLALSQQHMVVVTPTTITSMLPDTGGILGGTTLKLYGKGLWQEDTIRVRFSPVRVASDESSYGSGSEGGEIGDGDADFDADELDESVASDAESMDEDEDSRVSVTVNAYFDPEENAIICCTPEIEEPGPMLVELAIDGQTYLASDLIFTFFELPVLTNVSPRWVPMATETVFTISGTGFQENPNLAVRLRVRASEENNLTESWETILPATFVPAPVVEEKVVATKGPARRQTSTTNKSSVSTARQGAGGTAKTGQTSSASSEDANANGDKISFIVPRDLNIPEFISPTSEVFGHRYPVHFETDVAINGVDFTENHLPVTFSDLRLDNFEPPHAPCTIPVGETRDIIISGTGIVESSSGVSVRFVIKLPGSRLDPRRIKAFTVKGKRKKISSKKNIEGLHLYERGTIVVQVPKIGTGLFSTIGANAGKLGASVEVSLNGGTSWVKSAEKYIFYLAGIMSVAPTLGPMQGGNSVNLRIADQKADAKSVAFSPSDLTRLFGSFTSKVKIVVEGKTSNTLFVPGRIDGGFVKFTMPQLGEPKVYDPPAAISDTGTKGGDESEDANEGEQGGEEDAETAVVDQPTIAPVGPAATVKIRVALDGLEYTNNSVSYVCYDTPALHSITPTHIDLPAKDEENELAEVAPLGPVEFEIRVSGVYDTGSLFVRMGAIGLETSRPSTAEEANSDRKRSTIDGSSRRKSTIMPDGSARKQSTSRTQSVAEVSSGKQSTLVDAAVVEEGVAEKAASAVTETGTAGEASEGGAEEVPPAAAAAAGGVDETRSTMVTKISMSPKVKKFSFMSPVKFDPKTSTLRFTGPKVSEATRMLVEISMNGSTYTSATPPLVVEYVAPPPPEDPPSKKGKKGKK